MDRKTFFGVGLAGLAAYTGLQYMGEAGQQAPQLKKSKQEWRKLLTDEQYAVLFEEDTERPFSHPLNN